MVSSLLPFLPAPEAFNQEGEEIGGDLQYG
jgi:hypothetical protein